MQPTPTHSVSANDLPEFYTLAMRQSEHIQAAAALTRAVILNGKPISISEFSDELQSMLQDSVGRVVEVSKQAIIMLYEVQNLRREIDDSSNICREIADHTHAAYGVVNELMAETKKRKIDRVRIEELKEELGVYTEQQSELSKAVEQKAQSYNEKSTRLEGGLAEVAGVDIIANLAASERLNSMMHGFEDQQTKLYQALIDAMRVSKAILNAV